MLKILNGYNNFIKKTYFWKPGMNIETTVKTSTGEGNGTFSLRWITVNGMVCLSWGLLFRVSCWIGSAMSATK